MSEIRIYADMIETTLEEIFTDQNLEEALDDLSGKRDTCGPDGIALSQLPHFWEINGRKTKGSLLSGSYRPGTVQNIEIVNRNGKRRKISVMNSVDRLILRSIAQVVQPVCDKLLPDNCFAFREGKGATAVSASKIFQ